MGQVESAIDVARRKGIGKSGPWRFEALTAVGPHNDQAVGTLYHYGTPIFRVNLKTGQGEVGQGAWGSVSDQTGIRKAAAHLSKVLGGTITVSALSKKEILEKRDRARAKGQAFSNPSGMPTKRAGAYRLDAGHAHIGKGLVYCKEFKDSAPPLISHSRVRCALCGKTVSSMHNPVGWALIGAFATRAQAEAFANRVRGERGVQDARVKRHPFPETTNKPWTVEGWGNWEVQAFRKKNPAVAPGKSPAAHFLRSEMMGGKTPAAALRAVAQRFAGRLPRAALRGAFDAVRRELVDRLEGDRTGMSDWAGMSAMRMGSYKRFSRNPAVGRTSPTLIYGRAKSLSFDKKGNIVQMTARKTEGPYKGENFVHDFKPGVRHIGLPRGTEVTAPGGRSMKLKTRAALMVGPRDIWRNFAA